MNAIEFGSRAVRKSAAIRSRFASQYFVSLGKADPDLIFIAGVGRSGTTWLAEILARNSRRRLVFEPFRNDRVALWEPAAAHQYIRPHDAKSRFLEPARQILGGGFRNEWADYYNERLLTRGRIVKDIRANLMLRWLYDQLGPFPLIFLVRHPAAVATSWLRESWSLSPAATFLSQPDLIEDYLSPFERELTSAGDALDHILYIWSIETALPLCQFSAGEMLVVFYENLLIQPDEELARVAAYLGGEFGRLTFRSVNRPSSTTTPGISYESQLERFNSWRELLTEEQLLRVKAITSRFGVDTLYGPDGAPSLKADAALDRRDWLAPPPDLAPREGVGGLCATTALPATETPGSQRGQFGAHDPRP